METSDSDYFESADEDFQTDDEDVKTVKVTPAVETDQTKFVETVTTQVKRLKLQDTQKEINLVRLDTNKNENDGISARKSTEKPNKKDDENNVTVDEICPPVETEPISKEVEQKIVKKLEEKVYKTCVDSKESQNQDHNDENLWDDDEIDWGKEAEVTEKQLPVESKTSEEKVDDNLWDDSELDWGKEAEISDLESKDNLWDDSELNWDKENKQESPRKEQKSPVNSTWSSWGNWGVSTILTTATQSVSTITQGITTVLESGIGVPEPEELARIDKTEKDNLEETSDKNPSFGLNNLVIGVSQLTKLVETTGTKVISGGLDTLETIGKKTMEVLQEGDPGLKKKRAFLKIANNKPVLSQVLREAKEKHEKENKELEERHFAKKTKNYETLFDDHQGLVHLEALEMLSKQCDIKLQTLLESYSGEALTEMQETMDQVKELCELPDEEEDEQNSFEEIKEKLETAVREISIPISYKRLIELWEETQVWLDKLKLDICDERELHQQAIETLAQLTAVAVEQFHKSGELLLVKEHRSTADEADSLVQLTTTLTSLIGVAAAKFSDKLNGKSSTSKNKEEINGLITNVFLEAANSSSYIQDAFQLLIPVLQVGAV